MAMPERAVAPSRMAAAAAHAAAAIVAIPIRARLGIVAEPDRSKTPAAQSVDTAAIHKYRVSCPVASSRMLAKANGTAGAP